MNGKKAKIAMKKISFLKVNMTQLLINLMESSKLFIVTEASMKANGNQTNQMDGTFNMHKDHLFVWANTKANNSGTLTMKTILS